MFFIQIYEKHAIKHSRITYFRFKLEEFVSENERKVRFVRIADDLAAKTVEIRNAFFTYTFVPTFAESSLIDSVKILPGTYITI